MFSLCGLFNFILKNFRFRSANLAKFERGSLGVPNTNLGINRLRKLCRQLVFGLSVPTL